jgi:signal transduction histidine kinase/ligand-binding sensor domain-containing protein
MSIRRCLFFQRALRFMVAALAGWLATSFPARAADTNLVKSYLIENWNSARGLPQNTVTGIAQSPDGYLWITTLDGVARFDGLRFKIYKAGDAPELGSGRIRFLFKGRHGELRLATQEGGLVVLRNGQFAAVPLPDTPGGRAAIVQVAEDKTGSLWLSTEDGKVARWTNGQYVVTSSLWDQTGKAAFEVREDANGGLWAIEAKGLYELSNNAVTPALLGKRGEYAIHCPGRGGGWWLSNNGKLELWRDHEALLTLPGLSVTGAVIRVGLEDRGGHLWLGTWGNGLFRCDTNGSVMQLTRQDGLGSDFIRVLCEDSEGNLWVGTEGGGLNRLALPLFAVYGLAEGLSWEWITSVSQGPGGELWVGTDGYGLNELQGDTFRPVAEAGTTPQHVMSAIADRQGTVWLGTRAGGMFRFADGQMERFSAFPTNGLLIRSLFEDSRGDIWVGRRNTDRLVRIHGNSVSSVELPKGIGTVDVRVISEDAHGALWVGTDGNGLLRYQDGQFAHYTREHGLANDLIWSLQPEADGSLWVGTFGNGLTRIKEGRMANCSTKQGLADDVICWIADDGHGQYWMTSHQGVFRVDKKELNQFADGTLRQVHCVTYGKSEGLPTLECKGGYQPAGWRGAGGRLWFPTIAGVAAVNPAEALTTTVSPPVYIEEILVDGKPTDGDSRRMDGEPAQKPRRATGSRAGASRELEIPPGNRRIEFHYTGLNLAAPERLQFRHKLEGVDAEWVETGGRREASYDRLARGTYTFRVQACNREGSWSADGGAVSFRVLPYFWQTWWFIGLFLVTFGGAVGWLVATTLKQRHRRHLQLVERLHAAERERTRIARDIHDDLGSSLTEIGLMGAMAVRDTTSPAEARDQIARMMGRVEDLARKLDETVWAVNPKYDSLPQLATYLCSQAREFLEPANIRCRLEVQADLPDVPLGTELRHNLMLAAKEALNNAVRHSGATELWLRIGVREGGFIIEVADNGRGCPAPPPEGAGNGLRNMADRMHEIGGEFELRAGEPSGTIIRFRLPLPPQPGAASGEKNSGRKN